MSHLLWWHLDDVMPIAEHAMACVEHRLTTEQVRAGGAQRAALVWTTTDTAHLLESNGSPVWYDADGRPYAAEARTWRHIPTGRIGGADHPSEGHRFWPLARRSRDRRYPLIKQLRTGARHRGHWLVVDTRPAMATSRERFTIHDHRDDLVPPAASWAEAKVTAAAAAHLVYPALVAAGYTITGDDVIARFTHATVTEMIADLDVARVDAMPGELAVLDFDGDILTVSFDHDTGAGTHRREIDRVHPDPDGLYAAGAYLWPWRRRS